MVDLSCKLFTLLLLPFLSQEGQLTLRSPYFDVLSVFLRALSAM